MMSNPESPISWYPDRGYEELSPLLPAEAVPLDLHQALVKREQSKSFAYTNLFGLYTRMVELAICAGDADILQQAERTHLEFYEAGADDTKILNHAAFMPAFKARIERRLPSTGELDLVKDSLWTIISTARDFMSQGANSIHAENSHLSMSKTTGWLNQLTGTGAESIVLWLGIHNFQNGPSSLLMPSSAREETPVEKVMLNVGGIKHDIHGYYPYAKVPRAAIGVKVAKDHSANKLPEFNIGGRARDCVNVINPTYSRAKIGFVDLVKILEEAVSEPDVTTFGSQVRDALADKLAATCRQSSVLQTQWQLESHS